MRVVEKEGRTKQEAIRAALEELGARPEDVRVECLDEGHVAFLGLGRSRPARVRVYLISEKERRPGAETAPPQAKEPPPRRRPSAEGREVAAFVEGICAKMGVKCSATVAEESEERMTVVLESPDAAFIIGHRGQTLEAIQYIVNIAFNGGKGKPKKILLDIENYREKRKASLEKLARNIAQKVRRTRQPHTLEAMNPYERRIIHLALEKEKDIETVSLGSGDDTMKRIRIQLKAGKSGGGRSEGRRSGG